MSYVDFTKLSIHVKKRRDTLGLREAEAQSSVSASTLSRLERATMQDINVSTLVAVCDWLNMPLSAFLVDDEQSSDAADYSLNEQLRIAISHSDLRADYQSVLMASVEAFLRAAESELS